VRNPVRSLFVAAALIAGCATTPDTKLEVSWVTPQLPQERFKKLLIITVAGDEFVQIAFQDQMAAALQERGPPREEDALLAPPCPRLARATPCGSAGLCLKGRC